MKIRICKILSVCLAMMFVIALVCTAEAKTKKKNKKYASPGTPTRAIQDLDDILDDFKVREGGKPLSKADEKFNRDLKQKIITGTFDVRELAMLSLGKHWNVKTPKEQQEFVDLLTQLLEEKALFSKEQSASKSKSGGKYNVIYRGHKYLNKDRTRAFVATRVVVPSENITITLNYKMKKKGPEWKIYDIVVDEASLVDNYKYQFNSIITKHGYPDLVSRMSSKLTKLKKQRDAVGPEKVITPPPSKG